MDRYEFKKAIENAEKSLNQLPKSIKMAIVQYAATCCEREEQ